MVGWALTTKERGRAKDGENFHLSFPLLSPVHSPDLRTAQPGVRVFNFSCLQRSCAGPFLCPAQLCGIGQCRFAAPLNHPCYRHPRVPPVPAGHVRASQSQTVLHLQRAPGRIPSGFPESPQAFVWGGLLLFLPSLWKGGSVPSSRGRCGMMWARWDERWWENVMFCGADVPPTMFPDVVKCKVTRESDLIETYNLLSKKRKQKKKITPLFFHATVMD